MLDLECHQGKLAMCDPFDLARFAAAQDGVYQSALAEIRRREARTLDLVRLPAVARLGT